MDATEDREVSLIRRFAEEWMADHIPNQPVRADGKLGLPDRPSLVLPGAEPGDRLLLRPPEGSRVAGIFAQRKGRRSGSPDRSQIEFAAVPLCEMFQSLDGGAAP